MTTRTNLEPAPLPLPVALPAVVQGRLTIGQFVDNLVAGPRLTALRLDPLPAAGAADH